MTESGRYIAITPAMEAEAETMRRTFEEIRQACVPGAVGVKRAPLFLKAALLARKYNVDPATYAARMVRRALEKGMPVFPTILLSKGLFADSGSEPTQLDTGVRYRMQLDRFRTMLANFSPEQLLRDSSLEFSPVFRYAMATIHRLDDVRSASRAAAKLELLGYPQARSLFSDQLGDL